MNLITLGPASRTTLSAWLADGGWIVACLCARWCDLCVSYRATFSTLAALHPDKRFVWIDIEDEAEFVGDMEIDNFPTLLMQRDGLVAFFGPLASDLGVVQAVLQAQARKGLQELAVEINASPLRKDWQRGCRLRC